MGNIFKSSRYKIVETFVLIGVKLLLLRYFFYGGFHPAGLPGELLSVLALLCLVELVTPAKGKWWTFFGFNFVLSFILFAATVYFAYFGTVPTYKVLSGLGQVPEVKASIGALLRPEQFLYFADLAVLVLVKIIGLVRRGGTSRSGWPQGTLSFGSRTSRGRLNFRTDRPRAGLVWKVGVAFILIASLLLSGLYIRAGKGIDNELVRAESVGFLNFQVDAAIRDQEEERMIAEGNLQETIAKIRQLQSTYPYRADTGDTGATGTTNTSAVAAAAKAAPDFFGAAQGMNLIVVQMESFQNFPINLTLNGQEITPVLNNLAKEGFYFPHVFQQIGPGNTSDAEFMSNTSIYPTAAAAMSTSFGDRELPSLPRLLQGHGYVANTFHINKVTFWDRNKLYPALHFDKYYDKPYYTNDHFNDFGASDEEMYRVGVEKLAEIEAQSKPFYAQFVTTSSHSPFVVPKDRQHIQLPAGMEGTMLGNYIQAVNYTDYAIGTLIDRLKQAGLWDNTMLVFYGDHFGLQPNDVSAEEISEKLGIAYDERISRFNIPLIVHVPGAEGGQVVERTGGQVDIMPTIAGLLGVSLEGEGFTALGQDLLSIDRNVIGMRYYLPTGSFFNDEVMFVPGQGFDDGTAVSLKTLQPVTDISAYRGDYDYVTKLMKLSDEYVKLLPKRGQ
ncbi:LTA synthase family protein [Paenibacillus oralis]|uniref:LTA synthase family protein n=1 Tax=Paenibacillus oralis TaxID=2490856 RepID=A0A3P3U1Q2_9BACL|nr:LTA synthase family protein [Paenibacillus oralis]RRJ63528.1 LTA synthase family protein [Paenibacillus oralis]